MNVYHCSSVTIGEDCGLGDCWTHQTRASKRQHLVLSKLARCGPPYFDEQAIQESDNLEVQSA
ncbi:hypothetical protein O9929_17410 [Vibrio lentus]|nr:hypothetical protein [Vibrio lentus]